MDNPACPATRADFRAASTNPPSMFDLNGNQGNADAREDGSRKAHLEQWSISLKFNHNDEQLSTVNEGGSSRSSHPGGWRSMPYILLSEMVERFASSAIGLNFISYLMGEYGMGQVRAASILAAVSGTANLTPLLGAFLSEVYLGRFYSLIIGSVSNLFESVLLILTATCPSLRPRAHQQASASQVAFLMFALGFTTISAAFLRPCTYAFGIDQFEQADMPLKDLKNQIASFFNWHFFSLHIAYLASATILVYVQDNTGWVWGFSISGGGVLIAIFVFLIGSKTYRHAPLSGSAFTSFAQVIVAAFHKRQKVSPSEPDMLYYGNEIHDDDLPHTKRIMWLDKAAIVSDEDLDAEGKVRNPYRLCRVSQVEELKAVMGLAPLWGVNLLSSTVLSQSGAFDVPQARMMDRHIGHGSFEVPPASMSVFVHLTLLAWMPLYDRVVVPALRRVTGLPGGITTLQRVGLGFIMTTAALVVSGLVESERRRRALASHAQISVLWLLPQYCLHGLAASLHGVGLLEFLYDQLPYNMRNMAGALFSCCSGIGHYASIFLLQCIHKYTATPSHVDWLANDLNQGHLDYFFFLLAILQGAIFVAFLIGDCKYTYNKHQKQPPS